MGRVKLNKKPRRTPERRISDKDNRSSLGYLRRIQLEAQLELLERASTEQKIE